MQTCVFMHDVHTTPKKLAIKKTIDAHPTPL